MYINVGTYSPFAEETLTITNAAVVTLTSTSYASIVRDGEAVITIETNPIRYWFSGTHPSTTVGHLALPTDVIILKNTDQIKNFHCIATGGNSTLSVSYFRR